LLARRPRAARRTQRARVDGLGRVGGLGRKTRRLVAQRGWTRRRRLGRAGRCGRRAARVNWRLQCESEPAMCPAQRPLLPGPPMAGSSRLDGGALRGRFGLRAWTARALRNLGGPRRPGAAIRRSAASMQFTKLRSGLTWPPFRALLKPTAPTPMPAPTPARRRHVHKSESFCINCEVVRGSWCAAQVPAKCHFGGLKPALRL
jgi:hypothetical protein